MDFLNVITAKEEKGRKIFRFLAEGPGKHHIPWAETKLFVLTLTFIEITVTNNTSNNNMSQSLSLFHNSVLTKTTE